MATRQDIQANIPDPAVAAIQGSGAGGVSPKPVLRGETVPGGASADTVRNVNARAALAATIMGYGQDFLAVAEKASREEAYLKGAAQVGAIASEEELDSDLLTRNWTTAGYRDTLGRLAMAEREAQIAADMPRLRERTPEDVRRYLDTSRQALMPRLEGMSRQARSQVFSQLLTSDRAALTKYTGERAAYIVDTQTQAIQAGMATQVQALEGARANVQAYAARTHATVAYVYGNIEQNPNLPGEVKQELTFQALRYAIGAHHPGVYELAANGELELADGRTGTLLGTLPLAKQEQLAEAYRKAQQETTVYRNSHLLREAGAMRALLSDKTKPLPAYNDFEDLMFRMQDAGLQSPDQYLAWQTEYGKAALAYAQQGNAAAAYQAGDVAELNRLGMAPDEALKSWLAAARQRGLSFADQLSGLVSIGLNGMTNAFQEAGKMLEPGFAQMVAGKAVNPDSLEAMRGFFSVLDQAEANGQKGVFALALSGLGEEEAAMAQKVRFYTKRGGMSLEDAQSKATDDFARIRSLSPGERRAMGTSTSKASENLKLIEAFDSRGFLSTMWTKAKSFVSDTAGAELTTRPENWFWSNSVGAAAAVDNARFAYAEELAAAALVDPFSSPDERHETAMRELARRTIPTADGPIYLQQGMSLQQAFGLDAAATSEQVGRALDTFTRPRRLEDAALTYSFTNQGTLRVRQLNAEGLDMGGGFEIPKDQIQPLINERRIAEGQRGQELLGSGVRHSSGLLQYNGSNTASVDPSMMLEFRRRLVEHEGVRNEPYPDGKGGQSSNGVGINTTNAHYPKDAPSIWPPGLISSTFAAASSDAAKIAVRTMQEYGLGGRAAQAWLNLLGDIAYQRNTLSDPSTQKMLRAAVAGDADEAVRHLQALPAYQQSGAARQGWRVQQLRHAIQTTR